MVDVMYEEFKGIDEAALEDIKAQNPQGNLFYCISNHKFDEIRELVKNHDDRKYTLAYLLGMSLFENKSDFPFYELFKIILDGLKSTDDEIINIFIYAFFISYLKGNVKYLKELFFHENFPYETCVPSDMFRLSDVPEPELVEKLSEEKSKFTSNKQRFHNTPILKKIDEIRKELKESLVLYDSFPLPMGIYIDHIEEYRKEYEKMLI